jgi:peptide-methionine (S)-S-oxide reductase
VFFSIAHDPTQLNYRGPDHGTQYRSVIFYSNEGQKAVAEGSIVAMRKAKTFSRPSATQVVPLTAFYAPEDYHQHFMDRNPSSPLHHDVGPAEGHRSRADRRRPGALLGSVK